MRRRHHPRRPSRRRPRRGFSIRAELPEETARKTSGQDDGGGQVVIQLDCDQFGPEALRFALKCGEFRIPRPKHLGCSSGPGTTPKTIPRLVVSVEHFLVSPYSTSNFMSFLFSLTFVANRNRRASIHHHFCCQGIMVCRAPGTCTCMCARSTPPGGLLCLLKPFKKEIALFSVCY